MSEKQVTTGVDHLPFTGLCCPKCEYNLTGTTEPRCPECGEVFDPDKLRPLTRYACRISWRITVTVMLLALYLPNTWIFWISYSWHGGYRAQWARMFPILPALVPTAWLTHWMGLRGVLDDIGMFVIVGSITAVILVVCTLLGRRSWRWLIAVSLTLFAVEVFNAWGCHALFRM